MAGGSWGLLGAPAARIPGRSRVGPGSSQSPREKRKRGSRAHLLARCSHVACGGAPAAAAPAAPLEPSGLPPRARAARAPEVTPRRPHHPCPPFGSGERNSSSSPFTPAPPRCRHPLGVAMATRSGQQRGAATGLPASRGGARGPGGGVIAALRVRGAWLGDR